MFGWLQSLYGWTIGGLDDLWNKVIGVIQAVYSYINAGINNLIHDIEDVYNYIADTVGAIDRWVQSVYTSVADWAQRTFSDITSWVSGLFNTVFRDISDAARWTSGLIDNITSYFSRAISSLSSWVSRDIWDPLYNFISGALNWIANEGAYVFNLLTHPELLARLIGEFLLATWISLGRRYAAPLARWILHALISEVETVAGILEDMIAAIL